MRTSKINLAKLSRAKKCIINFSCSLSNLLARCLQQVVSIVLPSLDFLHHSHFEVRRHSHSNLNPTLLPASWRELEGCCSSSTTCTLLSKGVTLPLPLSRGDGSQGRHLIYIL